jgi:hypothetical protein
MIIGKLTEALDINFRNLVLESVSFSTNLVIDDISYGTIQGIVVPDTQDGIFQIGEEKMSYKYYESYKFYTVTRGYLNTPVREHAIDDLIYKIDRVQIKNYDSLSIYDWSIGKEGLILDSYNNPNIIRGMDVISQNVYLTLQSIGNEILNNLTDIDYNDLDYLAQLYLNALPIDSFIYNVVVNSITQTINGLEVNINAETKNKQFSNLQVFIPVRSLL